MANIYNIPQHAAYEQRYLQRNGGNSAIWSIGIKARFPQSIEYTATPIGLLEEIINPHSMRIMSHITQSNSPIWWNKINQCLTSTSTTIVGGTDMNKNLEKELNNILSRNKGGFEGFKDRLVDRYLKYSSAKIKNHFGVEMKFSVPQDIQCMTNIISKFDKNFDKHISNSYANKDQSCIDSEFIVTIDKATFMYVRGEDCRSVENPMVDARTLYVYIFGKRAYAFANYITKKINTRTNNGEMVVYTVSVNKDTMRGSSWICTGSPIKSRGFDTLYFDGTIKEEIISHLDKWVASESIYKNRGLMFKTGILIHGIAGTGKSSIANAIATHLGCDLISIDTTTFNELPINDVVDSINADNRKYVILLDEIDAILQSRDDDNGNEAKKENTTKLLTFLDSVQSPDNVVFVATTNYLDRLDNAILRKGRFDKMIETVNFSKDTAIRMCKSFEMSEKDAIDLVRSIEKDDRGNINPATLQSAILENIRITD